MIETKKQLKEVLIYEQEIYRELGYKGKIHAFFSACEVGYIYRYIEALRNDEYYTNCHSLFGKIVGSYWKRKHNRLGVKLGISIPINTIDKGLKVYHAQSIIVHRDARIGKDCTLHGMNCIGNDGSESFMKNTPTMGDLCDIGVGASVIGGIALGNNIKIAAGAVVCRTCEKDDSILIGVPAKSQ